MATPAAEPIIRILPPVPAQKASNRYPNYTYPLYLQLKARYQQ